jgi:hypothetical protein
VGIRLTLTRADGRTRSRVVRFSAPGDTIVVDASAQTVDGEPAERWCAGAAREPVPAPAGAPAPPDPPSMPPAPAPPPAPVVADPLAQAFRPHLLLDSGERWRPLEAGAFLAEQRDGRPAHALCAVAEPFDHHPSRCAGGTAAPLDGVTSLLARRDPATVLDLNADGRTTAAADAVSPMAGCRAGGLADCDRGARTAIYERRFALGASTVLDYWLLYRFNDAPYSSALLKLTDNDHEGDWEGVSVGLSPDATRFDWVGFAGHGAPPRRYLRATLSCDGASGRGSCAAAGARRVHVFVARGTHASYPVACRDRADGAAALPVTGVVGRYVLACHQTGVASPGPDGPLPEGEFDGARRWGADDDPAALRPLPPLDDFTGWPGRWGLPGAVQSPGRQWELARTPDRSGLAGRGAARWRSRGWRRPGARRRGHDQLRRLGG